MAWIHDKGLVRFEKGLGVRKAASEDETVGAYVMMRFIERDARPAIPKRRDLGHSSRRKPIAKGAARWARSPWVADDRPSIGLADNLTLIEASA